VFKIESCRYGASAAIGHIPTMLRIAARLKLPLFSVVNTAVATEVNHSQSNRALLKFVRRHLRACFAIRSGTPDESICRSTKSHGFDLRRTGANPVIVFVVLVRPILTDVLKR
jgi:hypothetical protein